MVRGDKEKETLEFKVRKLLSRKLFYHMIASLFFSFKIRFKKIRKEKQFQYQKKDDQFDNNNRP